MAEVVVDMDGILDECADTADFSEEAAGVSGVSGEAGEADADEDAGNYLNRIKKIIPRFGGGWFFYLSSPFLRS